MRTAILALTLVLSPLASAFAEDAKKLSLADLIEKCEPSCVRVDIESLDGQGIGSGFIAQEGDWVVTNYHVVAGARKGQVSFSDNEKAEIEGFLAYDKRRDVAVLKLKLDKKRTPLTVAKNKPRKGEAAIAIGAPRGLSFTASEGIISAIRTGTELKEYGKDAEGSWLQITVPISPGSSGGPLLSDAGELIGATAAGLSNTQNVNFAISAEDISTVLAEAAKAKVQPLSKIEGRPLEVASVPRNPRPITGAGQNSPLPGIPNGDTLTIKLPAERRFTHRYRLSKLTDEFSKTTWLRSDWITMKHNDARLTSAAFRVGIPYGETGPTADIIWELAVTSEEFAFTNRENRTFQMIAGEDKFDFDLQDHKTELNKGGGGWRETMSTKMRLDKFVQIALAKKESRGRIGPMDFVLGSEELECFRELLSKVPDGKASDGLSNITVEHFPLADDPTAPVSLARAAKAAQEGKTKGKEPKETGTKESPPMETEAKAETKPAPMTPMAPPADEYRVWISADGKFQVEAKIVRVEPDVVRLQRKDNGKLISVPLTTLCDFDRKYLAGLKTEK